MHKLNDICCLKESLITYAMDHKDDCDIQSYGQVIDMIKDLYEAEKYCFEACYFKTATEELRQEELDIPGRHGYDHWRTNSGRFARKGTGHFSPGYPRLPMIPNDMRNDDIYGYPMNGNYGYDDRRSNGNGNGNGGMSNGSYGYPRRKMVGRYGYPMDEMKSETYNEWNDARRHYHDTKDQASKHEMDEHGMEHVKEVVATSRDIYKEASPEMRQKLKNEFTKMMADFNNV